VARVINRVIFFAMLAVIGLAAIPHGASAPWWAALFAVLVFVLGVLWAIEEGLSESLRIPHYRLLIPLLAILAFAFLQSLPLLSPTPYGAGSLTARGLTISVDPYQTRRFAYSLLALVLAGVLLLRHTSSPRRLRALITVIIGVGVASAVFGLVWKGIHEGTQSLPNSLPDQGFGQFLNRNHFAFLMEMVIGLTIGLVAGGGVGQKRAVIYLAAAIIACIALVSTDSRGGILSMMCQVAFIAILFSVVRHPAKTSGPVRSTGSRSHQFGSSLLLRGVLTVSLLIVVGLGVMWLGGNDLVERLDRDSVTSELSRTNVDTHLKVRRQEIWRATWQLIKANPIAGVGFGGYSVAIPKYFDYSGRWPLQQAHNDYLEFAASGGAVAVLLGLWFVVELIRTARQRLRSVDPFRRATCFGALSGLFGIAIHSFFDFGLHITINALVCTALIVIAVLDYSGEVSPASLRALT
jgi:O-antigen ligase